MKYREWAMDTHDPSRILLKSSVIAFLIEVAALTAVGWQEDWISHPGKKASEEGFIETEVLQMPPEAHLVDEKRSEKAAERPDLTLSKVPDRGKPSRPNTEPLDQENKTTSGPQFAPTHGPVAIYSPPPVIPSYLQDQEFKTHVIIDFYVNSQGTATPRLVGSSDNEELDAIALESTKKWVFRPAEQEGKPVDSKVRLRIVFVVQ